jgi:ASC-1-like (ASCH) protein
MMKLKDHPLSLRYKLVCPDCGSKNLEEYDPFKNWFTTADLEGFIPNHLILECLDCYMDIYPEEDLEKLEEAKVGEDVE